MIVIFSCKPFPYPADIFYLPHVSCIGGEHEQQNMKNFMKKQALCHAGNVHL